MGFFIYDIGFLVIFSFFVFVFLYLNRKRISREGLLYLYKTMMGIRLINYIGKKFERQIRAMRFIVIGIAYLLLAGILFILGQAVYIYLRFPEITKIIKTPPLVPLIPYFPSLFGVKSFFPPFYFTYFIIALIIVAFSHEFAHGIFARANKVRIKSTGVAFLGPILGAFVEQDDNQMKKRRKTAQMSILGAGVFANTIMAILFFILLILVFNLMFIPAGAKFSAYSYGLVNVSSIISITEKENGLYLIETPEQNYVLDKTNLDVQLKNNGKKQIVAYFDAPAINNNLSGAIIEIQGVEIKNLQDFILEMENYAPGDKVKIKTTSNPDGIKLELRSHPLNKSRGFLGVGFSSIKNQGRGIKKIYSGFLSFKDPSTYYKAKYKSSDFFYNLIWWVALINFMVALFNMLPFAFLDGGRFFYLTLLGITKNKKIAEIGFKYATLFVILLLVLLMSTWVFSFI